VSASADAPEATVSTLPPASGEADSIQRARQLAQDLAGSLQRLSTTLDDTESERDHLLGQCADLQQQVKVGEEVLAGRDRLLGVLRHGKSGSLTDEDVQAIQTMMDALKQDPDRLTVLFTVVQHAAQLADVISDYSELRRQAQSLS
jgi:hypothetical protein